MLTATLCDYIANIQFTKDCVIEIKGYYYHSVNVITLGLPQSDKIKRFLL